MEIEEYLNSLSAEDLETYVVNSELNAVRQERDRLIAETDWWANSDLTMTTAQISYRQSLRDITKNCTSLMDVVWPTKP